MLLNKDRIAAVLANIDDDDRPFSRSSQHLPRAWCEQEVRKSGLFANFENQLVELVACLVTPTCMSPPGRRVVSVSERGIACDR
jgi:hypothetical protein